MAETAEAKGAAPDSVEEITPDESLRDIKGLLTK